MKIFGVIPARFASERFPGKMLADICGKPMIQHVYERSKKTKLLNDIFVATDAKQIYNVVKSFGGNVVMTSKRHKSGTDRIAEAVKNLDVDIVANIPGDEPLIMSEMIDKAISPMIKDMSIVMSTLANVVEKKSELLNPNTAKIVLDKNNFALYFSRLPIPYLRDAPKDPLREFTYAPVRLRRTVRGFTFYKHIGVYVYTKKFLLAFTKMKQSSLEIAEKLEQLRVLENGYKIKVVKTKYKSIPVDILEDLERVKRLIIGGYRG
ncbi:MAG: 3-deoxy-manno-octulosonate cytidylyltransferase [Candidatus Firestonebacteria bacterium]